ncbi:hypothetical protein ACHEXL_10855 [Limnohabitans sp. yimb22184]|uniref:hypothetical protein n=1 Tax=Limnohabitans sp. YIMB22184 TaxID=3374104 RepID=UPI003A87F61F
MALEVNAALDITTTIDAGRASGTEINGRSDRAIEVDIRTTDINTPVCDDRAIDLVITIKCGCTPYVNSISG